MDCRGVSSEVCLFRCTPCMSFPMPPQSECNEGGGSVPYEGVCVHARKSRWKRQDTRAQACTRRLLPLDTRPGYQELRNQLAPGNPYLPAPSQTFVPSSARVPRENCPLRGNLRILRPSFLCSWSCCP
eukprot:20247_1